jgi:mitochondrial import inner membrane translocase subunit TIM23
MILHVDMVLRTAAIGCRLKPSISSTCTYHTATQTPKRTRDASSAYCRRPILQMATGPLVFTPSYPISRYSSSISSPTSDQHAAPSASTTPPTDNHLNWNTFFKLRKSRRRYQLGGSVCTSLFGMVGGAQSLAHSDMDWIVGQIPLDPFITLGLITFSCGGVGWLLGPVLGTGIFNTLNRKYITQMATARLDYLAVRSFPTANPCLERERVL